MPPHSGQSLIGGFNRFWIAISLIKLLVAASNIWEVVTSVTLILFFIWSPNFGISAIPQQYNFIKNYLPFDSTLPVLRAPAKTAIYMFWQEEFWPFIRPISFENHNATITLNKGDTLTYFISWDWEWFKIYFYRSKFDPPYRPLKIQKPYKHIVYKTLRFYFVPWTVPIAIGMNPYVS